MAENKAERYLGLCLRAGKLILGADNIEKEKKLFLIVMDESISENAKKKLWRISVRLACPLLQVKRELLGKWLARPAVKAVGLKEEHLANAVRKESETDDRWNVYFGGNEE